MVVEMQRVHEELLLMKVLGEVSSKLTKGLGSDIGSGSRATHNKTASLAQFTSCKANSQRGQYLS